MLRLPQFSVVCPGTVDEVVAAIAEPGARIVAGGTDLLPNLKHRLDSPSRLVSVSHVAELGRIELSDSHVHIGAGVTLTELAEHGEVSSMFPGLSRAGLPRQQGGRHGACRESRRIIDLRLSRPGRRNLSPLPPTPLVPEGCRLEADERVNYTGKVIKRL